MSTFRHHPDGIIYIGDLAIPLAEFRALEPDYPGLPPGVSHFAYAQGGTHFSYGPGRQGPGVVDEELLDGYIANRAAYEPALEPEPPGPPSKAETLMGIDEDAEAARSTFMTGGSGQALVYERKRAEAEAWQAAVDGGDTPDPAEFPLLKDRAERLDPAAPGYQAVADEWNGKSAAWIAVSVAIERIRETAKEQVALSETSDQEAADLRAGLAWPSPDGAAA